MRTNASQLVSGGGWGGIGGVGGGTWNNTNAPSKGPVTSPLSLRAASEGQVGTRDYDVFVMMHGNPTLAHGMQYFDITFNTL